MTERSTSGIRTSRRTFIKASSSTAALGLVPSQARAAPNELKTSLPQYPKREIEGGLKLPNGSSHEFFYPDRESPCILLKLGHAVAEGVGPDGDLVAFSRLCSHQGCPVDYRPEEKVFQCPCHFSRFDAEQKGQVICGQATVGLPRILLHYDPAKNSVTAVGVDGLIYGRVTNII